MKTIEVPKPYREAYVVQQALVALGFSSDNIYVGCVGCDGKKNVLVVSLREQDKEFFISVADMGDDAIVSEVNNRWAEFASDIVAGVYSHEELQQVVSPSNWSQAATILLLADALRRKGFVLKNG